jgi:NADH-quinone oxidoreductase subunit N
MQLNLIHYSLIIIIIYFLFGNFFALSEKLNFPTLAIYKNISFLSIIFFLNIIGYLLFTSIEESFLIFNNFFILDNEYFEIFSIFSFFFFIFLLQINKVHELLKIYNYEFLIIFIIIYVFFLLLISCTEFISFYFILEIISFCFYILVCITLYNRNALNSAFKYLIIGSLSSAFLLLGFSFLYAVSGHTEFEDLKFFFMNIYEYNYIINIGVFFILISFLIKLYVAPFHFWIVDIYENIPISIICFFSSISFLIFFYIFINWYFWLFNMFYWIDYFLIFFSITSMFFGSLNGLFEFNLKRIFAYSSIANIGYQLLFLTIMKEEEGIDYSFSYTLCILLGLCILSLLLENVDLIGLYYKDKNLAFGILLSFFILSATPPSLLSIMKLNLISNLNNYLFLIIILFILCCSFLSAYFYIRLIKIIVFSKPINYIYINEFSILRLFFIYILFILNIFLLFDSLELIEFDLDFD